MAENHHFAVLHSEVLFDTPILALRRDAVRMPGGEVANREIIEHFGAVAVVALDASGNVAMVRQYRQSVGTRLWELPAGLLDIADEDPLRCAQRELQEEAGLAAGQWALLHDLVSSPGFAEEVIRIYLARDIHEVPKPEAEGEEADMRFAWVPLEQAVRKIFDGEIVNATAIAGILAAHVALRQDLPLRPADADFPLRPRSLAERRKAEGIVPDMKRVGH